MNLSTNTQFQRFLGYGAVLLLSFFLALPNLSAQDQCDADAGTLAGLSVSFLRDSATIQADPRGNAVVPDGFQTIFVLTSTDSLVIEAVNAKPEFTVFAEGIYTIHTLVFDPNTLDLGIVEFGATTGFDVNALLIQGGGDICASLDVAGGRFTFEADPCEGLSGGTVAMPSGETVRYTCPGDGVDDIVRFDSSGVVGENFTYVVTDDQNNILGLPGGDFQNFEGAGVGVCRVWGLAYIGELTAQQGDNAAEAQLSEVCWQLSENFITINRDNPDGGRVTTEEGDTVVYTCPGDGVDDIIPFDSSGVSNTKFTYVVTDDANVILGLPGGDTQNFEGAGEGVCRVWGLAYTGNITAQPGDNAAEVALSDDCFDLSDNFVTVNRNCDTTVTCDAMAGTLSPANDPCLEHRRAELLAQVDEQPTVPEGFDVIYVLTRGDGLVIQDVNSKPQFTVKREGRFRIHTLVFDPQTLDLGIVEFGETTGFDVNNLLIQGGGDVCASLDVAGAVFDIEECEPCLADAGKLRPLNKPCLRHGRGLLQARFRKHPDVPEGFRLLYVLTSGKDLVIEDVSSAPLFMVHRKGRFTIHSLVYDPGTLDLGIIEFGKTTGFDVNGLLEQGGGDICASLDLVGAPFKVDACRPVYSFRTQAYPNPATDAITLEFPQSEKARNTGGEITVELYDLNGQLVKRRQYPAYSSRERLDVSNLQNGMYTLRVIIAGEEMDTQRITKMN